jgi:hypothetical protein
MTMQIELWALLTFLVGLLITFLGGIFGFAKVLGGQIDKRLDEKFAAQEEARETGAKALRDAIEAYTAEGKRTADQLKALERDFLKWQAELPVLYVRREDYIRGQSVIEAKLDALYNKLEVVQLKGATHG